MPASKTEISVDWLLLLELALAVGRMQDDNLEERCNEFLRILLSRKNLSFGAIWLRLSKMDPGSDTGQMKLVAALPKVRSVDQVIPATHPGMIPQDGSRYKIVRETELQFAEHVVESNLTKGSIAIFKLSDIGVLRLHSLKLNCFTATEVNQLFSVFETFAISIRGALSQQLLEKEAAKRRLVEQRLIHAQKMEAVGHLTGGIAHDFNNLLAIIQGSAEILSNEVGPDNRWIGTILRSSRSGAELVQRLLAFSRQQTLKPQAVDLIALVRHMHSLLNHTVGPTIQIEIVAKSPLQSVMADPGQLENALLNLAINARDAMPKGGKLTIHCEKAGRKDIGTLPLKQPETRQFIALSVTDTGNGMSDDVKLKAFDPFFTSKDTGKGNGMGLSTVYGFAKQSGGHAVIDSAPGRGTTVTLLLPETDSARMPAPAPVNQESVLPKGDGEKILVLEDDDDLRAAVVEMLEDLNYRAQSVPDAHKGLEALEKGTVDAVLTDIVMPGGLTGHEFASIAKDRFPDLRFIFMSGHPRESAIHRGKLAPDVVFLNKPFRKDQLAFALPQAIDKPDAISA